jgi:tetratricopeptide (TPR) repeat protein
MRNLFFITVALVLGSLHCFANADYSAQWQKGNSFYQQKQYDSAAYYYEEIAALKPINAEIYYNLGNTYYRLNKIGLAVLNYERALKADPDYKEAKDNLLLAQSRISNSIQPIGDIFFIRWWKAITIPRHATALAITALCIFLIYIGLLLAKQFKKVNVSIQFQVILIAICVCFLTLAFFATKAGLEKTGAVVMEADAPLPEGTVIKIKQEQGDWIEVILPDGREGWLRQDLIVKI